MTPIVLFDSTSMEEKIDYQGEPVKASSWYGLSGLHTIAIYYQNFIGRVSFEGTLSKDIDESTIWFPIKTPNGYYVEFPQNPKAQTSVNGGDTGVYGFTFKANVMWIRARVDRSYYMPETTQYPNRSHYGAVRKIMMAL